ncbi:MAG: M56 family metallopeptidase, partial [Clostridiales bacterium]
MIIALCFLFGLFRLAIYLTPEAAGDETTHYRPGDCIWSLLRGICLGFHGYNPLVWWAAILSRNDAELACDEATIKRIGEIEMTCQGHPALLLTATAMTGSKSSMKECITLIVKKPKTAIYTLVTVLLIAAVAAGCALAGTAGDKDKPWTWMQNLVSEDITSATAWYGYSVEGSRLSDSDTVALISLLNAVGKTNFTENKQAAGATPQYGLAFDCGGASYYINEAVSPSGSLEMSYGGKQWWI